MRWSHLTRDTEAIGRPDGRCCPLIHPDTGEQPDIVRASDGLVVRAADECLTGRYRIRGFFPTERVFTLDMSNVIARSPARLEALQGPWSAIAAR